MIVRRVSDFRAKFFKEEKNSRLTNAATINSFAFAIEARDPYTRGHSERVATYAVWLAEAFGIGKKKTELLRQCCRLHDVGKIGVPDNVLLKPSKLTLEERAKIQLHPVYGAEILGNLKFIEKGMPIILHHHERHDGKGYPYGLKKDRIPLEVKIISIADAFDAMTSDRPYRKAMPLSAVVEEFKRNSGTQFDPRVVKGLLKLMESKNQTVVMHSMKAA